MGYLHRETEKGQRIPPAFAVYVGGILYRKLRPVKQ